MKSLRPYQYAEGDVLCRLCGEAEETMDHVINNCTMLPVADGHIDISSLHKDDVVTILARVKTFQKL